MLELIGLQEDLIERACARILENRESNDLSSTAVVFPSKRFGFFVRRELAAGMDGNFFPPALFPIEAFFETLFKLNFPGHKILDELEAAHAVHESARVVFKDGMYGSRKLDDFASFLPWAQKILGALEEILTEGGRTEGIDFAKYEEFTRLGDYHRSYKEFILKIPVLLADLQRRLDGCRQATRGMACRRVADLAEENNLKIPSAQHWIFSGFNAMNACEKKLFSFFHDKHGAQFILRTDPMGLNNALSPFHLQAETIRGLGMIPPAGPSGSNQWDDLAEKVIIHPCDGVESEIYHAFKILEQTCRGRDEAALKKVAVLLPSAPTLIPFVQGAVSRFDQDAKGLPFNITLGYPLERTPMMQLVDSLLTVLENTEVGTIEASDYLQLIRHPYVKISGGGGDLEPLKRGIHLLENIIDGGNLIRFSIGELEAKLSGELQRHTQGIAPELAAEITAQVFGLHQRFIPQGITGMQLLLAFLKRALESVGSEKNRGCHLFLNEYAATALQALEELGDFAHSHDKVFLTADIRGMTTMVRSHFRGRTIRFEGSPLQGVQVMGPLEFRGLSFDEVIVLDALEGVLPGTAKYDPILPADIRAIFGIRDHGDWEKIYAFNFFAMLGAAKRVHVLYPRKSEDGKECERSRFIERIVYAAAKKNKKEPAAIPLFLPFDILPRELRTVEKNKTVRERLGAITLSPSSIETYVKCPLQFYFSKVLGLREREEVAAETEGSLIGTIAHTALEVLYDKYPEARAMTGAGEKALEADLEKFLYNAFRKLNFNPERGLEHIRSWTLLEQLRLFTREDGKRIKQNVIQVEKREKTLSMDLKVPGLGHRVSIRGRLDRLEREGNLLRVVDYKTGSPFPPKVRVNEALNLKDLSRRNERGYFDALSAFRKKYPGMQLQVYLMLLAREQGKGWDELDAAYVFLREKSGRMVQGIFMTSGRNSRPFIPEEKRRAMEAFVNDLGEVLNDLYSREYFLANPGNERYCSYCPFRLPCGNL
ncbi:MAG TPA: PD-(D/E)XK nuclease family protein [Patescibacteria group bacterium]|nr:PD-(D/E)XK nuclease family protein [Patescibacteria group bacterium]